MNTVTRINISSVMGIREAIEQIFTLIHRHFDAYAADTSDSDQLEECRYYMHQLNGMLEMLDLHGVAFVGGSVEELLLALQEQRVEADTSALAVVHQAVQCIYRYLDALIDGEEANPVKLFPLYRKLMQVQGVTEVPESDLFFPDMRESLPLQPVSLDLDTASRQEMTKQARSQFQSGLLGWLKDANDKQSLQQMIEAVRSIETLPASIEQRKFWWISSGFLDSLLHQEQVVDKSVRRLCGKIEQEIRHLNKESHVVAARLTRELLYRIARSQPVSERLQEINRVYDWRASLSAIDNGEHLAEFVVDEGASASDLQGMRELLEDINEQWRKFNVENQNEIQSLQTLIERFKALAAQANCPPLEKLAGVVYGALSYLRIQPQSMHEGISLDIASSLLLAENALDNFYRLSAAFPSQVEALAKRIRMVTTGKGDEVDLPELPNPDQAGHLAQEKKLFRQVAQEMLTNLAQVEDILDRFFTEPKIRNDLPLLPGLFEQISGVLDMLELEQGSKVLGVCETLTEKLTQADEQLIDQSEQTLLADALSSLGFYIEALRNAQSNPEEILAALLKRLEQPDDEHTSIADVSETSTQTEPIVDLHIPAVATVDQPHDPELLAIFLEEAKEVLASIAEHLAVVRADNTNQDALTTIRRNFHTLKGSGRMVKLDALSEVAWRVEQLMNRWLSEQKDATDTLLDLLADSHKQFGNWCASLEQEGTAEIKADSLLDRIKALMYGSGEPAEAMAAATTLPLLSDVLEQAAQTESLEESPVDIADDAALETEATITIGDNTVPADLFNIFIEEADTHIATLKQTLASSAEQGMAPSAHASMLAAHTLASTSSALKLDCVAQIGQVLERWFNHALTATEPLAQETRSSITTAVDLLENMLASVREQQFPSEEAVQAGQQVTEALQHALAAIPTAQVAATEAEQIAAITAPELELAAAEESPAQKVLLAYSVNMLSLPIEPALQTEATATELDQELLTVFLEEAQELQSEIGTNLRAWRQQPDQSTARQAILRALHTLKGSARTAGVQQVSEQAHQMESDIQAWHEPSVSTALLDQLEAQFDSIISAIEQIQNGSPAESIESVESIRPTELAEPLPVLAIKKAQARSESLFSPEVEEIVSDTPAEEEPESTARKMLLRVDAELIDRLINESGESSIVRSQVEAQLYNLEQYLQDLRESVDRMRSQLREMELLAETQIAADTSTPTTDQEKFDPLELDRFTRIQELPRLMAESMDDIATIEKSLREVQRTATMALDQQAYLNRQLQQSLLQLRTIPFSHYAERFHHIVRQVAKELGKQAELVIQGGHIELDRDVLDKISSPLEHLLRNALVHGIETPKERSRAGKEKTGKITLTLQQESNEIVLLLQDDGIGLNVETIREKARLLDLVVSETAQDDEQWYSLIFTHGFSTLNDVTNIAGRGVGLDIVRNELGELGGNISVTSEKNQGTAFTLRFPVSLAVTQALMVKAADNTYAIPLATVEHILEMNAATFGVAYEEHHLIWNNNRFPLVYLPHLLDVPHDSPAIKRSNRIVLLHAGEERLAIHADAMIGQCEVVVKPASPQVTNVPGIEGATITGEGNIVLVINPLRLLQCEQVKERLAAGPAAPMDEVVPPSATAPVVMIVDDSLTVRKVTSRLLERQGYEILIAKDGVGALQLLREIVPAVMLIDIEMPHMDGFELIRTVRNNPELQAIPIIVITSRTAEKHRKVAEELGVSAFMGKPYQEDELLQHIERLVTH